MASTRRGIKHPDAEVPGYLSLDDLATLWGIERAKLRKTIQRLWDRPKEFHFPESDRRGDHNKPLWKEERLEELNTWWERRTGAVRGGSLGIRSLREAAGLTQLQAAKQVGLTRSGWAMLEAGRVETLDANRAEQIAEMLGTDAQTVADAHARTRAWRKAQTE